MFAPLHMIPFSFSVCTLHLQMPRSQRQECSNDDPHRRLEQPVELSKAVALRDGHQMERVCACFMSKASLYRQSVKVRSMCASSDCGGNCEKLKKDENKTLQ